MWHLRRSDSATVFDDENVRASLARYLSVTQNQKPAKFLIAKKLAATFSQTDPTESLWKLHVNLTMQHRSLERQIDNSSKILEDLETPAKSYLDLKIELASRIQTACRLCNRKCGVNRFAGQHGYCGCGTKMSVSTVFEHMGEEPELTPSGTVFTMGCTMRCLHCQNWTISQWKEAGETYEPNELAPAVERLRRNGCRNINLVGGEPTPWLAQWLATFKHVAVNVPVVWNSNSYYSPCTAGLLAGFADVYLLDFKYGNNSCAQKISDAPHYWETCTRNHLQAKKHGELIIRVLVLPNHLDCCTQPILRWIAENLGVGTRVNLMFQYRPEWRAYEIPELGRNLTSGEMKKAVELANQTGLTNFIT